MHLLAIIQQFPDNAAFRVYADQLKREAMERWVASTEHPDRRNHIAYMRAEILVYASQLQELFPVFEDCIATAALTSPKLASQISLMQAQVHFERLILQAFLETLDEVEALPVECGASAARANSHVADLSRLLEERIARSQSAKILADARKLISGVSVGAE